MTEQTGTQVPEKRKDFILGKADDWRYNPVYGEIIRSVEKVFMEKPFTGTTLDTYNFFRNMEKNQSYLKLLETVINPEKDLYYAIVSGMTECHASYVKDSKSGKKYNFYFRDLPIIHNLAVNSLNFSDYANKIFNPEKVTSDLTDLDFNPEISLDELKNWKLEKQES